MHNFDSQELHKFNQPHQNWWDTQGDFRLLHLINPLRLAWITHFVDIQNKKVLDLGCGGGILAEALAKKKAQVTGIDLSESALEIARSHSQQENLNIDYQHVAIEDFAELNVHQYDVVVCMELLEHVPCPESIVKACARLVKLKGWVFFATINRTLKSYLLAVLAAEYILKLLPRGTHDYAKFIRPAELAKFIRQAKLRLHTISGIEYRPYSDTFVMNVEPDINYWVATQYLE